VQPSKLLYNFSVDPSIDDCPSVRFLKNELTFSNSIFLKICKDFNFWDKIGVKSVDKGIKANEIFNNMEHKLKKEFKMLILRCYHISTFLTKFFQ